MDTTTVTYYEISGADGKYFRCERYRCGLSTNSCAKRWRSARAAAPGDAERVEKCRGCPIGAAHAGQRAEHYSPLYRLGICGRCRRGGMRLIYSELLCVSCYNRAVPEWRHRGTNSKGTIPLTHPTPRRLTVLVNGLPMDIRSPESADTIELVLSLLGNMPGRMLFSMARRNPATTISVQQLAAIHRREAAARDGRQRVKGERGASASAVAKMIERRAAGIARSRQRMAREARG
jgi:hypothetical protein